MKSVLVAFLVSAFSLNIFVYDPGTEKSKISDLENSFRAVSRVVQIDYARQMSNQKVVRILDRFNPGLETNLKQEIANEIYAMSVKYPNLDVDLICATITHESARTWNPMIVSNAGAMGLMQIMPATGKMLAKYEGITWTHGEDVLFNPIYNIRLGTRYLSALIETYDLEAGLAAYNGGWKIAEKWLESDKADGVLWNETQNYIPYVLKLYDEFKGITL